MHTGESQFVTNGGVEVRTSTHEPILYSSPASGHPRKTLLHSWRRESAKRRGSPVEFVSSIRYPKIHQERLCARFYGRKCWRRMKRGV